MTQEVSAKQFWELRRYLRQNKVETGLSIRIHCEHASQVKHEQLKPEDIKILSLLSEQFAKRAPSVSRNTVAVPHDKCMPYAAQHPHYENGVEQIRSLAALFVCKVHEHTK